MITRKLGGLVAASAYCSDCEWEQGARNAMGLAAQHHYKTGHSTHVETTYAMTFCADDSEYYQQHLQRKEAPDGR